MQKPGRYVAILILVTAFVGTTAWYAGKGAGRREMMVEAVQQNHGHYRITDNVGSTVFEWGAGVK